MPIPKHPFTVVAAGLAAAALLAACGGSTKRSGVADAAARVALPSSTAIPVPATAVAPGPSVSGGGSPGTGGTGTLPAPVPAGGTVTTVGTATVSGTPDTVTADFGVSVNAAHAGPALAGVSSDANQLDAVLERAGVGAADIQTESVSLEANEGPGQSGYSAETDVEVTIHGVSTAGRLIDLAVAAAGDAARLNDVSLSIANSSPLVVAARRAAVADARTQAEQLAGAAGERLGSLISLSDASSASGGYEFPTSAAEAGGSAAAVPINPGSEQLSEQVIAVWSLES